MTALDVVLVVAVGIFVVYDMVKTWNVGYPEEK